MVSKMENIRGISRCHETIVDWSLMKVIQENDSQLLLIELVFIFLL